MTSCFFNVKLEFRLISSNFEETSIKLLPAISPSSSASIRAEKRRQVTGLSFRQLGTISGGNSWSETAHGNEIMESALTNLSEGAYTLEGRPESSTKKAHLLALETLEPRVLTPPLILRGRAAGEVIKY